MRNRLQFIIGMLALAAIAAVPARLAAQTSGASAGAPASAPTPDITQSSEAVLQALGQLAHSTANEAEHYADTTYSGARHVVTDSTVTTEAKAALLENQATTDAATLIHVDTSHGVVTLSGQVASAATATSAQQIVAQLVGVKQVVNDLNFPASISSPALGANPTANAGSATN